MNIEIRKATKDVSERDFFKVRNYSVFGNTKGNIRDH